MISSKKGECMDDAFKVFIDVVAVFIATAGVCGVIFGLYNAGYFTLLSETKLADMKVKGGRLRLIGESLIIAIGGATGAFICQVLAPHQPHVLIATIVLVVALGIFTALAPRLLQSD
jgi:hypothetical protein